MSKKKTLTAVFVILICILIGGVLLRQYKRANTTECILKGTITAIENNVFTVVPRNAARPLQFIYPLVGFNYSVLSSPQKNSATVPGPVCAPMVVPTWFISTLPLSFGKRASTRSATALASS